jgi:hypothetical protein
MVAGSEFHDVLCHLDAVLTTVFCLSTAPVHEDQTQVDEYFGSEYLYIKYLFIPKVLSTCFLPQDAKKIQFNSLVKEGNYNVASCFKWL